MAAFDTSTLTPSERRVLALLAAGHTAKSIALELNLTVHSVNERLREARRKAGAGSSRELARVVATQENRDKEIGLAMSGTADATRLSVAAHSGVRRWQKEAVVVIIIVALALTAWGLAPQISSSDARDPYRELAQPATDTATLYRTIHTEKPDQTWATQATSRLQNIYASVPGVKLLRVTCAASLCEVAGQIAAGEETSTTYALQDASITRLAVAAGFDRPAAFAVGSNGTEPVTRFLTYWPRHRAS